MQQINVSLISQSPEENPQQFEVEVLDDNKSKVIHQVTVSKEYYQRLTGGLKSMEELIRSSFEFLLERESKESILSKFDLTSIQKYFPEYEKVISMSLAK